MITGLPLFDQAKREPVRLNSTVEPRDEPRLSRQAEQILDLFMVGKTVTTAQMMAIAGQYNARLYEVRRHLIPLGWCIDRVARIEGGINAHQIVSLSESDFYARNRHKF